MTQPHHHVFNALEPLFHRKVPILPLIPILIEKNVISTDETEWFKDEHNGMKILTGYLRSRDYDTFLKFIESVFEASDQNTRGSGSSNSVDFSFIKTVEEVVVDFDKRYNTAHADRIQEIMEMYSRKPLQQAEYRISLDDLNVPFLNEKPYEFSFSKNGGTYCNMEYDIRIVAPSGVCEEGSIEFRLGVCTCGPFSIADEYQVITPFICVETNRKLEKPVCVYLQHCLRMKKYEKTQSVIILRADYQHPTKLGEYAFEPYWGYETGGNKKEEKHQIVRPEISSDSPHLWFEIDEFCILCGVLKNDTSTPSEVIDDCELPKKLTVSNYYDRKPVINPEASLTNIGKTPSLEEDGVIERSGSLASSTPAVSSVSVPASAANIETDLSQNRRIRSKRKKSESSSTMTEHLKRRCVVEYAVIFTRNRIISSRNKFCIFVCQYCMTSIKECVRQASTLYQEDNWEYDVGQGVFTHNELEIGCEIDEEKTSNWKHHSLKTSIIKEDDIHRYQKSCNHNDLKEFCAIGMYPPRSIFEVYAQNQYVSVSKCRFVLKGFEFSDKKELYFSVLLMPTVFQPTVHLIQPLHNKELHYSSANNGVLSKAEQVFRDHFSDLKTALTSTEALQICTYLYSDWVIDEEDFLEVLNEKGFKRIHHLLTCTHRQIIKKPNSVFKLLDALEENTVLTSLIEQMKQECGVQV